MAELLAAAAGFVLGLASHFIKEASVELRERPILKQSLIYELLYSHKAAIVRLLDLHENEFKASDESLSVSRLTLTTQIFDANKNNLYKRLGRGLGAQVSGYYTMASGLSNKDIWPQTMTGYEAIDYMQEVATAFSFLLATADCLSGKSKSNKDLERTISEFIAFNWSSVDVERDDSLLESYGKSKRRK